MKNEIKEILEDNGELMVRYKDNSFECFDTLPKNVVNYITNLQEENERLKEYKEDLLSENIELENIRKEAIEYIKENSYFEGNEIKTMIYQDYSKYILEILQGKSDE